MNSSASTLLMIAFFGLAIVQLWAGYLGIEHHFGYGWALAAVAAAFVFRFPLPLTVGSFFGALDVWQWHWVFALLLALPGLAFMLPATIALMLSGTKR